MTEPRRPDPSYVATLNGTSVPEWIAWAAAEIERLRTEIAEYRFALRLHIANLRDMPWQELKEDAVDSCLEFSRQTKERSLHQGE